VSWFRFCWSTSWAVCGRRLESFERRRWHSRQKRADTRPCVMAARSRAGLARIPSAIYVMKKKLCARACDVTYLYVWHVSFVERMSLGIVNVWNSGESHSNLLILRHVTHSYVWHEWVIHIYRYTYLYRYIYICEYIEVHLNEFSVVGTEGQDARSQVKHEHTCMCTLVNIGETYINICRRNMRWKMSTSG